MKDHIKRLLEAADNVIAADKECMEELESMLGMDIPEEWKMLTNALIEAVATCRAQEALQ